MLKTANHLSLLVGFNVAVSLHGRLLMEEAECLLPSSEEKADSSATSFPLPDPVPYLSQIPWVT